MNLCTKKPQAKWEIQHSHMQTRHTHAPADNLQYKLAEDIHAKDYYLHTHISKTWRMIIKKLSSLVVYRVSPSVYVSDVLYWLGGPDFLNMPVSDRRREEETAETTCSFWSIGST